MSVSLSVFRSHYLSVPAQIHMRDYQTTPSLLSYFKPLSQRIKLGLKESRLCLSILWVPVGTDCSGGRLTLCGPYDVLFPGERVGTRQLRSQFSPPSRMSGSHPPEPGATQLGLSLMPAACTSGVAGAVPPWIANGAGCLTPVASVYPARLAA